MRHRQKKCKKGTFFCHKLWMGQSPFGQKKEGRVKLQNVTQRNSSVASEFAKEMRQINIQRSDSPQPQAQVQAPMETLRGVTSKLLSLFAR